MDTRDSAQNMAEVERFYDSYIEKMTYDFLCDNPRISGAIRFLLRHIPEDAGHALDIGCGLGWTSFETARHFPETQVLGIDLSERLIQSAGKLFHRKNLQYKKIDLISPDFAFAEKFDVVAIVDVYEHIPKAEREAFHQNLKNLVSQRARIIITCPTPLHQQWLRDHEPDGLQPVDEDVDLEDMSLLAEELGGKLCVFSYLSIWHTYDYFHAMIDLNPERTDLPPRRRLSLLPKINRLFRVFGSLPFNQNPLRKLEKWPFFLKQLVRGRG